MCVLAGRMVVKEVELQCEESSTDYAEVSIDKSYETLEPVVFSQSC